MQAEAAQGYSFEMPITISLGNIDGFGNLFRQIYDQSPTARVLRHAYESNEGQNPVVIDIRANKHRGELLSVN